MNTSVALAGDKQGIVCEGGKRSACGQRGLPERGAASEAMLIRSVNFEPKGEEHWQCGEGELQNSYTFKGSYYNVYVKLATRDIPMGK